MTKGRLGLLTGVLKVLAGVVVVAVSLASLIAVGNFQTRIQANPATSNFVMAIGGSIIFSLSIFAAMVLIFSAFVQRRADAIPQASRLPEGGLRECKEILYEIDRIDKSGMNDDNKVKYAARGVIPRLGNLLRNYKEFVSDIPRNYRTSLYEIYHSLEGKHEKYKIGRMRQDLRYLKESLSGLLMMYHISTTR